MAISASLLPFRSSRHSSSPIVKGDEPSTRQSGLKAGANNSSRQGPVSMDDTKKATRKNKMNFFHRVSIRISKSDSAAPSSHLVKQSPSLTKHLSSHSDKTGLSDPSANKLHPPSFSHARSSCSAPQLNSRESADMGTSCSSYPSDSLEHLKDIVHTASDSPGYVKSRSSRASLFFWKRTSQSLDSVIQEEAIKTALKAVGSTEETIQTSASSDGAPSSIMSSEMSEFMCSAHDTTETSVSSVEENDSNDCGLAGIGIRDRNSISLHSLPLKHSISPKLSPVANTNKLPFHPAMRYAPSNSSPLSSRSHSLSQITANNSIMSNLNPASSSSKYQSGTPSIHRQSLLQGNRYLSSGRLNLVPNQSCIGSEDLMRILRGPSSYPEETLPRSSDRSSLYLCV